ncbi:hypothetical protein D3C76_1729070 [compost metagenome]
MVIHSYGKGFLCKILSDNILIQNIANVSWLGNLFEVKFFLMAKLFFYDLCA